MSRFSLIAGFLSLSLLAGCNNAPAGQPAAASKPLDEKATAVRLQAVVYELRIAPEQVASLDASRLASLDLSHLPADQGEARPLYNVDQQVSLAGDRVMVGTQEPMITSSRLTDKGQKINTVQYQSLGAIVDFKAERTGPRELRVTSTIEVSSKTEGPVEISPGVNSSVMRKATMSLKGTIELGKPAILVSGDASSKDKDGKAVVYVARIVAGG